MDYKILLYFLNDNWERTEIRTHTTHSWKNNTDI